MTNINRHTLIKTAFFIITAVFPLIIFSQARKVHGIIYKNLSTEKGFVKSSFDKNNLKELATERVKIYLCNEDDFRRNKILKFISTDSKFYFVLTEMETKMFKLVEFNSGSFMKIIPMDSIKANSNMTVMLFKKASSIKYSYVKDTSKTISLSYNIILGLFNDNSLYADIKLSKHDVLGISIGQIYYNKMFKVDIISPNQATWPGTVYHGFVGRVYYNYIIKSNKHHNLYLGADFIYKNIAYDNVEFVNSAGDRGENHFIRSEQTHTLGWDFIIGNKHFLNYKSKNVKLFINTFCGFSIRNKDRNIDTFSSYGYFDDFTPTGKTNELQNDVIPIVGIKIGLRFKYK